MKKVKYKPSFSLSFGKDRTNIENVTPKNKTELLARIHNLINNEYTFIEIKTYHHSIKK